MLSRGWREVEASPPKNEAKPEIKSPENAKLGSAATRHGRAKQHGRPCHHARPCVHHARPCVWRTVGRAVWHGWPCVTCPVLGTFCPGCTAVHPCGTPVRVLFSAVLLFLDARDVLEPLIFLDLTFEVLFSIEIRWFLLKWRQTQFRHKNGSKEDNLTLNHLDLTWNEQEKGIK